MKKDSSDVQNASASYAGAINVIKCPKCGTVNVADAVFCYNCGSRIAASAPRTPVPSYSTETSDTVPSVYDGGAVSNFLHLLMVCLISAITLGLAMPAMICWYFRWETKHVRINGRQLVFDGKALQLFGKLVLWCFLSIITIGIYLIFRMPLNLHRWRTSHTHVVGQNGESRFTGSIFGLWGVNIVRALCAPLSVITLGFMGAVAKRYRCAWFAKRKIYDGQKLIFDGSSGQLFVKRLLWLLLTVVTIGIYTAWMINNVKKWEYAHTKFEKPAMLPPGVSAPTK